MFLPLIEGIIKIIIILFVIGIIISIVTWIKEHIVQVVKCILFVVVEIIFFVNDRADIAIGLLVAMIVLKYVAKKIRPIVYKRKEKLRERKIERQKQKTHAKITKWINEGEGKFVDIDNVMISVVDKIKVNCSTYFNYSNMPYGRAMAFVNNFENNVEDEEFYLFLPQETRNPFDVRENGILVAKTGIYIVSETKNSRNEYTMQKYSIEFKDCFSYDAEQHCIKMIDSTHDGFHYENIPVNDSGIPFDVIVENVIKNNIPQHLNYYGLASLTEVESIKTIKPRTLDKIISTATIVASEEARQAIYHETKNYMNGRQGGGYAAEYGNIIVDRLLGKDVINAAQQLDPVTGRQVKDGADRIVNGIPIQTKYHKNFDTFFKDVCRDGKLRYIDEKGKPMWLEVPRDEYPETCKKMQEKIDNGEISVPKGMKATDFISRGVLTYQQAQNAAMAGTIESLVLDTAAGILCTIPYVGVSEIIVFANCVWNGQDAKTAFKRSCFVTIKTAAIGSIPYVVAAQFTRATVKLPLVGKIDNPMKKFCTDITKEVRNSKFAGTAIGEKMGLKNIDEKSLVSNTVQYIIVFGPDIYKFYRGKISGEQLVKNSAVAAGGIAGGVAGKIVVGKLVGNIFGPAGSIIGGMVGGLVTKTIADEFMEDDAVKMFRIFKEEFLDIIMVSGLNSDEFKEISELTLTNPDLSELLQIMFVADNPRMFAREYINKCVVSVISKRKKIMNIDLVKGALSCLGENFVSYLQA